ncbi:MAG: gliding motility-associated C-terminal domain-containing protein [Bacteroidota bacterium]
MKFKHLLFIGMCLLANIALAQKQANHWYFGRRAGINFNTGNPVARTGGSINTREGCATIADANTGDLLFYTDGVKIYNKNDQLMPNGFGLTGNYSSTQSALIVPNPGNADRYYVFTTGILSGKGLAYSEVDLGLDGGNGDVVTLTKNTVVLKNSTEKLIALRHKNGTDYWIIAHESNTNLFYVYQITATGISVATTYKTGSILNTNSDETGYLKLSPIPYKTDIYRLVNAINGASKRVEIFDFNFATGTISSPVLTLLNVSAAYGVEFSLDGKLLYVSEQLRTAFPYSGNSTVTQFNLLAGAALAITTSKVVLASSSKLSYGALQLAPDGRIYVAKENGFDVGVDALGVITKPNILGIAADYEENGFDLGGKQSLIGLPTFAESFTVPFTYTGICLGEKTSFSVFNTLNVKSVLWIFGDPSSSSNTSTDLVTSHQFTAEGEYTVSLDITYTDNSSKTHSVKVPIGSTSNMSLGKDTTLCIGQKMTLTAFAGATPPASVKYQWQDGSTAATYEVTQAGTYSVQVFVGSCQSKDDIVVGYIAPAAISLGKDTTICAGTRLPLKLNLPGASFSWQDGSTNATYSADKPGIYWVDVMAGACQIRDSILVSFAPSPLFNLGKDTSLCVNNTLELNALNPAVSTATYLWQDGSTGATFLVNKAGLYWAEATLGDCKVRDSIRVDFVSEPPKVNLGPDASLSRWGPELVLHAYSPYATYLWQDGSTDSTLKALEAGTYWVEVTNGCGATTDTLMLSVPSCDDFQISNIITPNKDGYNDMFIAICDDGRWSLFIYNRWGAVVFKDELYKNEWEAEGLREDIYYYSLVNNTTQEVRRGWLQIMR